MRNIATCANGHNYNADVHAQCPYCPQNQPNNKTATMQNNPGSEKTRIIAPDSDHIEKTRILDESFQPGSKPTVVAKGTKIVHAEDAKNTDRKLAGFLVTYKGYPQGRSYKLYEGKNLVGSDFTCDIEVLNDSGISGRHLTILFRGGMFRFRDEFSTNGTFINGDMREEGVLEDKSIITIGSTSFCFLAIPEGFK